MKNILWALGAVIASVVITLFLVQPNADGETVLQGASPATVFDQVITAQFTQGGEVLRLNQTSATRTLTEIEMINSSQIVVDNTLGAALSVTLPATSTMTTLLKSSGQTRSWFIKNNHSDVATTTTIVAGAGIDLQGPTTGDDIVAALGSGVLTCFREYTTDVTCVIEKNVVAD